MVDYNLFEKILKNEDCGYIENNDLIDHNLVKLFLSSKVERVKSLFKKSDKTSYNVEHVCESCGNMFVDSVTKTKLFEQLQHLRSNGKHDCKHIFCPNCEKINKELERQKSEQSEQRWQKIKSQATDDFIESYLGANKSWKKGISSWNKIEEMRRMPVNISVISEYIKNMDYNDFLNTPYWKAVAERVKNKAKNRCQMCNSSENLNVHHRTYNNHGDELHHMEDLVCICKSCHQKYHFE